MANVPGWEVLCYTNPENFYFENVFTIGLFYAGWKAGK